MTETLLPTLQEENLSAEKQEQQLNFLAKTRKAITNELKLTFTLPNPLEHGIIDTSKDLFWKAMGIGGVYAGDILFKAGEQRAIMRDPGQTEQSFDHLRHAVEGVGIGAAALGALSIFLANRTRSKS